MSQSQKEIEVILTRQLASYLAMPVFTVDNSGTLIFYNEPAEMILGSRFEETGEMSLSEWSVAFKPTDKDGKPLGEESRPIMIALSEGRPAHASFWLVGLDNVRRHIEATAFPLVGHGGRKLGAVSIFWEVKSP